MGCFDNYIGVLGGCSESTLDAGGFYLNDIGITKEFLESVVTSDFKDVDDFVSRKVALAVRTIQKDVYSHLSSTFNTKSIIEGDRIGYFQDNLQLNAAEAGTMKGVHLQLWETDSFLNIFISKIQLQVNFTGNVPVLVYDLKQNKLLDTLTVVCVAGQISTLVVNKVYASDGECANLVFLYNASTFSSYKSYALNNGCGGCFKVCPFRLNRYMYGSGVTIPVSDPKIQENLEGSSDTGGLSVIYSLQCSKEAWLCTNTNMLAPALLYKTGELIAIHSRYYSNQLNSIIFDAEKLEERQKVYEVQYKEEIDSVLQNLRIPKGSACFFCAKVQESKTVLP